MYTTALVQVGLNMWFVLDIAIEYIVCIVYRTARVCVDAASRRSCRLCGRLVGM